MAYGMYIEEFSQLERAIITHILPLQALLHLACIVLLETIASYTITGTSSGLFSESTPGDDKAHMARLFE